jgi:hypothetical protein
MNIINQREIIKRMAGAGLLWPEALGQALAWRWSWAGCPACREQVALGALDVLAPVCQHGAMMGETTQEQFSPPA